MGIAAYNRGTKALAQAIDAQARAVEFDLMDSLNAMLRDPRAATPFGPIQFVPGHDGIWAECPVTGFGYWYRTLRAAVRAWNVEITEIHHGTWLAIPRAKTGAA